MYRSKNQFLARVLFWLVAEILLNCLGLDNMADYSEFIFEKHYHQIISNSKYKTKTVNVMPQHKEVIRLEGSF